MKFWISCYSVFPHNKRLEICLCTCIVMCIQYFILLWLCELNNNHIFIVLFVQQAMMMIVMRPWDCYSAHFNLIRVSFAYLLHSFKFSSSCFWLLFSACFPLTKCQKGFPKDLNTLLFYLCVSNPQDYLHFVKYQHHYHSHLFLHTFVDSGNKKMFK